MDVPFWIGDREFTEADINLIRETVERFSRLSREEIAATICENLPWKSPNGRLKMEACRKLLLELEQKGAYQSLKRIRYARSAGSDWELRYKHGSRPNYKKWRRLP